MMIWLSSPPFAACEQHSRIGRICFNLLIYQTYFIIVYSFVLQPFKLTSSLCIPIMLRECAVEPST